jgi:hypothetical protein
MNARGFATQEEATVFASKLKAATEISSVATRLGVDTGINLATSGIGQIVRDRVEQQTGILLRSNVHGVDVFLDDPNVRIPTLTGTASVVVQPDPFLTDLTALHDTADNTSQKVKDVILLLNYALLRPEPVAQIVFALSAVEMLGQKEGWSEEQRRLLNTLAASARWMCIGSAEERRDVSNAVEKSIHRVSLRQGVFRLLDSLGLSRLNGEWDAVYELRSTLVHGLAPQPGEDYTALAIRTVNLCGQILLKVIASEVPAADQYVERFYAIG